MISKVWTNQLNILAPLNRENTLEKASAELNKKGIKKPTLRQKLSYMLLDDKEHVVRCYMGENILKSHQNFHSIL